MTWTEAYGKNACHYNECMSILSHLAAQAYMFFVFHISHIQNHQVPSLILKGNVLHEGRCATSHVRHLWLLFKWTSVHIWRL